MTDRAVACSLTSEAIAARRAGLLPGLAQRAIRRQPLDDGLALVFTEDAFAAVASAIDAERRCCRFLRFDLVVEPDGGEVRLTLTGPPGTREFLSALIDA